MGRLVKELSAHEVDEIEGVYEYAKMAVCMLEEGRDSDARTFYEMAMSEKGHAEELHRMLVDEVERMEQRSKERGISVPRLMRQHYDERHARYVEVHDMALEYIEVYKAMSGTR